MKRAVISSIAVFMCIFLTGCSLLVNQGGKDLDKVFAPTASIQTVRKQLGQPTAQFSYPQPLAASSIPELVKFADTKPWLSLPLDTLIASHEDYAYKGRIYDDESEGILMCDFFTGCAFELFMFPASVYEAVKDSKNIHHYRVWYQIDGNYFGYVELKSLQR